MFISNSHDLVRAFIVRAPSKQLIFAEIKAAADFLRTPRRTNIVVIRRWVQLSVRKMFQGCQWSVSAHATRRKSSRVFSGLFSHPNNGTPRALAWRSISAN